jgi:hypothetical protein
MVRFLIAGNTDTCRPFKGLLSHGHEVTRVDLVAEGVESVVRHAKSSDFIVICGTGESNRLLADAIWHLLRNKVVISLSNKVPISDLREMYPLSKVSRAKLCMDAEVDRTLLILSHDRSFSGLDLASVEKIFAGIGEVLFVDEGELEKLSNLVDLSTLIVEEAVAAIQTAAGRDKALLGYALDWMLYGLGSAGINGSALPSASLELKPESREQITKAVKEVFATHIKRG